MPDRVFLVCLMALHGVPAGVPGVPDGVPGVPDGVPDVPDGVPGGNFGCWLVCLTVCSWCA